jgi:hypothetical protein
MKSRIQTGVGILVMYLSAWLTPAMAQNPEVLADHIVSIEEFGAVADAKVVSNIWRGTDNAPAINACAAYCREYNLTMLIPTGRYGVASTVWLTNPEIDGHLQSPLTVIGSSRSSFLDQTDQQSVICVLGNFAAGHDVIVTKSDGSKVAEPDIVPVLGIKNGRQVHVQGITVIGNNYEDYLCAAGIGNVCQVTTFENCSFIRLYAGIVFPCFRDPAQYNNVKDANNDLLVVEQSTLRNKYNIVCAATQPFSCEYRNSSFECYKSILTGTLITSYNKLTRGSHKFSSNLLCSRAENGYEDEVAIYFDLSLQDITIDSNHFETCQPKTVGETVIRCYPRGGFLCNVQRIAVTNNYFNLNFITTASPDAPLIDTLACNPMLVQGNTFQIRAAAWIKAYGAVFIGNSFNLSGAVCSSAIAEKNFGLSRTAGSVAVGPYSLTHRVENPSSVVLTCNSRRNVLLPGVDFKVNANGNLNTFTLTSTGKTKVEKWGASALDAEYIANDSGGILFKNFNPATFQWSSGQLTLIGNKLFGKNSTGKFFTETIRSDCEIAVDQ